LPNWSQCSPEAIDFHPNRKCDAAYSPFDLIANTRAAADRIFDSSSIIHSSPKKPIMRPIASSRLWRYLFMPLSIVAVIIIVALSVELLYRFCEFVETATRVSLAQAGDQLMRPY
jgi:hypothetical protein